MTEKEWIQIGIALIAGGAMGAILKAVFDVYQKRIQPVGYRIQFTKIFRETIGISSLKAELKMTDGLETRHFQNLFVAEIILRNKGNTHIDEFNFGITLGEGDVAIYTQSENQDRHHTLTQVSQVALGSTAKEIDFVCKPFNRKDTYSFKVFISIPSNEKEPKDILLSSSYPVKFVDLDTYENFAISIINTLARGQIGINVIEKKRIKSD